MNPAPIYRQCLLCRPDPADPTGTVTRTVWLPDRYARMDGTVRLRNRAGEWGPSWRVTYVSRGWLTEEQAGRASRTYLMLSGRLK